jgi:two-component system chemotaxis response regulator CheB
VGSEGRASGFICPECGGSLWEVHDGQVSRYLCHVGHAFGLRSLFSAQHEVVEETLWTSLRAVQEQAALADHMAERAAARIQTTSGLRNSPEEYRKQAQQAREHAQVIQRLLYELINGPAQEPAPNSRQEPLPG